MNTRRFLPRVLILAAFAAVLSASCLAQLGPQHSFYREASDIGISGSAHDLDDPRAVAIGPSTDPASPERYTLFVIENSVKRIAVFDQAGDFLFAFDGPNLTGEYSNISVDALGFDSSGIGYLADGSNDVIHKFSVDMQAGTVGHLGVIDLTQGGQVPNAGPIDISVAADQINAFGSPGESSTEGVKVIVLDGTTRTIEVFHSNGQHLRTISSPGSQLFELGFPMSFDVTSSGEVVVADLVAHVWYQQSQIKVFGPEGEFRRSWVGPYQAAGKYGTLWQWGPTTLRIGPGGIVHVVRTQWLCPSAIYSQLNQSIDVRLYLYSVEGAGLGSTLLYNASQSSPQIDWRVFDVASDGSFAFSVKNGGTVRLYRRAFRNRFHLGHPWASSVCQPEVIRVAQRGNSQIVDIDFRVNDLDDSQVYSALVAFRDGVIDLSHLEPKLALLSGSEVDPNPVARLTPTNQILRAEWDSAADLDGDQLVDLKVAALAVDNVGPDDGSGSDVRRLLGFHFLHLDDVGKGISMIISRSPLVQADFMPVWYWLLATQDGADPDLLHDRAAGEVRGLKGAFTDVVLASGTTTTPVGRAFILEELGRGSGGSHSYREATTTELEQARQATNYQASGTVNQWSVPGSNQIGGKPKKLNEWGFDTGDWGTDAWWVVREEVTP
jgi:hypothetical protein